MQASVYSEFFEEVIKEIRGGIGNNPEIIEIVADVSNYSCMLNAVHSIIEKENGSRMPPDIYVNLSAGSSDYVAAASMVSMMYDNVIPFTVKTKSYTIGEEGIRKTYYSSDGKPIGMSKDVHDPCAISKINVPRPDKNLVLSLRIVSRLISENDRVRASKMIYELKKNGFWIRKYDERDLNEKSCPRNDLTYFHRDFMDRWMSNHWIEKDEFSNTYRLTSNGKRILEIFYNDKNQE